MSKKCCSGEGEGKKNNGGGEERLCDKIVRVSVKNSVVKNGV
jgi:hypothetical protein